MHTFVSISRKGKNGLQARNVTPSFWARRSAGRLVRAHGHPEARCHRGFGSWRSKSPRWTICLVPSSNSSIRCQNPIGLAWTIFFCIFTPPKIPDLPYFSNCRANLPLPLNTLLLGKLSFGQKARSVIDALDTLSAILGTAPAERV